MRAIWWIGCLLTRCPAPPQTIPLKLRQASLTDRCEPVLFLLHAQPLQLLNFHLSPCRREPSYERRSATDGIGLGFRLGLLLLGNRMDLVKISSKQCRIRHILCGFRQL